MLAAYMQTASIPVYCRAFAVMGGFTPQILIILRRGSKHSRYHRHSVVRDTDSRIYTTLRVCPSMESARSATSIQFSMHVCVRTCQPYIWTSFHIILYNFAQVVAVKA